jgi:hypothetical protein
MPEVTLFQNESGAWAVVNWQKPSAVLVSTAAIVQAEDGLMPVRELAEDRQGLMELAMLYARTEEELWYWSAMLLQAREAVQRAVGLALYNAAITGSSLANQLLRNGLKSVRVRSQKHGVVATVIPRAGGKAGASTIKEYRTLAFVPVITHQYLSQFQEGGAEIAGEVWIGDDLADALLEAYRSCKELQQKTDEMRQQLLEALLDGVYPLYQAGDLHGVLVANTVPGHTRGEYSYPASVQVRVSKS